MHLRYVYDFKIWQTEEYLITHQTAASHFVLTQQDFKSDRVRNLVVQWVLFRISFWFRDAFEDGKEENTLSIVRQGVQKIQGSFRCTQLEPTDCCREWSEIRFSYQYGCFLSKDSNCALQPKLLKFFSFNYFSLCLLYDIMQIWFMFWSYLASVVLLFSLRLYIFFSFIFFSNRLREKILLSFGIVFSVIAF